MRVEQAPDTFFTQSPTHAISELQRTQHSLAEAQALAQIGSWEWDLLTGQVTWSDEHYRIFGFDLGTPIAIETAIRCVHPDDRLRIQSTIQRSIADRHPYVCELRIVRPDGVERVVEARGRVECDGTGHPIRKVGTTQDVTERTAAAVALWRVETQHRDFIENAVEGVVRSTPEGRFLMANQS